MIGSQSPHAGLRNRSRSPARGNDGGRVAPSALASQPRGAVRGGDMAYIERILIVGGGIAGLSVAAALRRQGMTPELVERSTVWPAVGAGINLPANGVRVLRELGIGEAVDRTAAVIHRWGFFDQQGELLCETDLGELWREVGPCLGITRVRLQEALLSRAAA